MHVDFDERVVVHRADTLPRPFQPSPPFGITEYLPPCYLVLDGCVQQIAVKTKDTTSPEGVKPRHYTLNPEP